jgi:hypothetical protein
MRPTYLQRLFQGLPPYPSDLRAAAASLPNAVLLTRPEFGHGSPRPIPWALHATGNGIPRFACRSRILLIDVHYVSGR